MKLLTEIRSKIKKILVFFETGKFSDYSSVYVYNDGKGNVPQVTLSVGFTQDYNLKKVLAAYCNAPKARYAKELKPYISRMSAPHLYQDNYFIAMLKTAGTDPVMQQVQDELFQSLYLQAAEDFADAEGFTLPLSYAVIADSYLQSGKIPMEIRIEFGEPTPAKGGDEKEWVKQYLIERKKWLTTRRNINVQKSIYRPNCFLEAVAKNNWGLLAPVNANGTTIK